MKAKTIKSIQNDFFQDEEILDYSHKFNEHLNLLRLQNLFNNKKFMVIDEEEEIKSLITSNKKESEENDVNKQLDYNKRNKSKVNLIFLNFLFLKK